MAHENSAGVDMLTIDAERSRSHGGGLINSETHQDNKSFLIFIFIKNRQATILSYLILPAARLRSSVDHDGACTQLGHPRDEHEPRALAHVRLALCRLGDAKARLQTLLWRLPQQEL